MATLLLLAVAALAIPTLATMPGEPDAGHATRPERDRLDRPAGRLRGFDPVLAERRPGRQRRARRTGGRDGLATAAGARRPRHRRAVGAALTSDLFVEALKPTMASLGLSEAFVGLVIVAIAGNAVENIVGVQAAAANKTDLATSLILNSSLQVAIALTPALVLISLVLGGGALTLVLTPAARSARCSSRRCWPR